MQFGFSSILYLTFAKLNRKHLFGIINVHFRIIAGTDYA